ncbi:c-type cytochrome biogenesis protein CcmI [Swaminathania salitolerans]|uniref:C-type cytochrome biogenesis protein CcmI n=1 Tax=Swaminathania salitolerans TaxID=182838 RepID=A0A511BLV5_9PROT|nr:c-type cytochrome biogenesis protein CcmI [Swaminathania salitolerans]GBQ10514.1 cytochrome c-type biogenesis protein CycH [Swaminathania salitolerans LMG 21291]GEL01317.1 hypothetical protein SSA02_04800 [Swaminathania salitolerans]
MSWFGFFLVTVLALAPVTIFMLRVTRQGTRHAVDARRSAMTLYRAQLAELERDRATGALPEGEYARARLEIERRLLAADSLEEESFDRETRVMSRLGLLLLALPLCGGALYLVNGHPSLPSQPHHTRDRVVPPGMKALFDRLAHQVDSMTPADPDYVRQAILLGQVDEAMGQEDDAIRIYRKALAQRFIPELALQIAELQSKRDGHISPDSLSLYRRALDAAPPDAPWRKAVEARIAAGEHEGPD